MPLLILLCAFLCLPLASLAAEGDENWDSVVGSPGVGGPVWSLLNGRTNVFVGGAFTNIGGIEATNIASWDGTNWSSLGMGEANPSSNVRALAWFKGELHAAGRFTTRSGIVVSNLVKWNGQDWAEVGGGLDGRVNALLATSDFLYIGGRFTRAGGIGATNICRWDGTNWSVLGAGIRYDFYDLGDDTWYELGVVLSLASDGQVIYAGGRFHTAGEASSVGIAKWDGANWHGLDGGVLISTNYGGEDMTAVRSIAASDGQVFACGNFLIAGGIRATNIARWDGVKWHSLDVSTRAEFGALAVNGRDLYAGGFFTNLNGLSINGLAKWDGTNWFRLGTGLKHMSSPPAIQAIISTGSEIFVGGAFTHAGGKPSTNIALWRVPHALNAVAQGDSLVLSWPATGSNFVLETSGTLTDWGPVATVPSSGGDFLHVTNSVGTSNQFYRLRRR